MFKKFVKGLSSAGYVTFVVVIIVIAYLLISVLVTALNPKSYKWEVNTKNVEKYVFVEGEKGSNNLSFAYIFDSKEDIEKISSIIDSATVVKDLDHDYIVETHYIDYPKYLYICYKDGSNVKYTFYGRGSSIFKDSSGKYGMLKYATNDTLATFIVDKGKRVYVDEKNNYIKDVEGFNIREFFGPDYDKAWMGK